MPELDKALAVLAEKLGVTAPYLWEKLVQSVFLESITSLAYLPILAVCWFAFFKWVKYTRSDEYREDEEPQNILQCIGALLLGAFTAIFLFSLPTLISGAINPEAIAAREIFGMFK